MMAITNGLLELDMQNFVLRQIRNVTTNTAWNMFVYTLKHYNHGKGMKFLGWIWQINELRICTSENYATETDQ
jgi:hypothetical protein